MWDFSPPLNRIFFTQTHVYSGHVPWSPLGPMYDDVRKFVDFQCEIPLQSCQNGKWMFVKHQLFVFNEFWDGIFSICKEFHGNS